MLKLFLQHPTVSILRYSQLVLALMVYCYFALSGPDNLPTISNDSVMHFIGNILLFSSIWLAFCFRLSLLSQLIIATPIAIAIEAAQIFSPSRQVDPLDIAFNLAGLAVGAIICMLISKYMFKDM